MVANGFSSYIVDNDRKFARAISNAYKATSDLTIPLTEIAKDWFKSNKAIFMLKSAGQYPDLKESTKEKKLKKYGFIYPIFRARGYLEESLTNPSDFFAIHQIENKSTLVIGTAIPYAIFHQSDSPRKVIPLRKMVFIGPESVFSANSGIAGRLQRWTQTLRNYVIAVSRPINGDA